jgi:sialic acid synthase SpsE/mannose-6-phosphate isomerase-like protein (cupin superfamily)
MSPLPTQATDPLAGPLFVFEMANNHMGSVEHGLQIIREFDEVRRDFPYRFAFKFQYRDLDTFIHPAWRNRLDLRYIKRFNETRLTEDQFLRLKGELDARSFVTVCTPFDERSVDQIVKHGFDIIKVASCSFTDWPLLERIVQTGKPLIASTAGAELLDIDRVVSFLEHREKQFALLHCVGEYPVRKERLQLRQISLLRSRYPNIHVGFSTHEDPDTLDAVQLAVAQGATIFEKHVGVAKPGSPLNAYSASPAQVRRWLEAARTAFEMCGEPEGRSPPNREERASLRSLQRGVFANRRIAKGERIAPADMLFAIPTVEGQFVANDVSKYSEFQAFESIEPLQALTTANASCLGKRDAVYAILGRVKSFLRDSRIEVPRRLDFEISHHYGLDRFYELGCTIITFINREYCKKLIVVLPGQSHPEQFHERKEETFHILHGTLTVTLDGKVSECRAGDLLTVERGVRHSFSASQGAVIEELSSTHHKDDSFYTDPAIASNPDRKSLLTYWVD